MKTSRILIIGIIFLAVLILFVLVAGGLGIYYSQRGIEEKREANRPPTVYVYTPKDGETYPAGTTIQANVSATGSKPITRIEMWLDGELHETQNPVPGTVKGASQAKADFELQVGEGAHLLYWRAVDYAGLIGQSPPVAVIGGPGQALETVEVTAKDGQTLEDIAKDQEADLGAVDELNPDLGGEPLPGGTKVKVPAPPVPGGADQPPASPEEVPPVDVLPPATLPVTPPGVPQLQLSIIPVLDISSILPLLAAMPKAPTNLEAGYEDCKIRLTWIDNADNETEFKVWMARLGGPPQLIATLGGSPATGPAWYEFKSPEFGIYSFWVEAVNALGGQPSEIKWVGVTDPECKSDYLATRLEIEALDMQISAGVDSVYCYLSLEGAQDKRIPEGDKTIQVLNQWGDITKYWGGSKSILLPYPADEEVSLEGECMGVSGNAPPVSLGKFSASVPREQWDGRRLEINGDKFIVGYRINPHGSKQAQGLFFYTDYGIPKPYAVSVAPEKPSDPNDTVEIAILARRPFISWKWDGDESTLSSFTIYLDGEILQWAEPDWRKTRLLLPDGCGTSYQVQIAANAGDAQSVPSAPFTYTTPACPVLVEVHFQSLYAYQTDDSSFNPFDVAGSQQYSPCDTLSIYGDIWATGSKYEVRHGSGYMTCKYEYLFTQLGFKEDKIVVPIDPLDPGLRFGTEFHESDFWSDDDFGRVAHEIPAMSIEEWKNYDETFVFTPPDYDDTMKGKITIRVRGFEFSE
jgi:hypothetical protein